MFNSLALMLACCALAALCLAHKDGGSTADGTGTATDLSSSSSYPSTSASPSMPFATGPGSSTSSKQLSRCRQSCYQKYSRDWHYCTDSTDCRNCWENCQKQLSPFELRIHRAQRQGALVLTDISWDEMIANASRQCLITWEVSGGGLIGNLLTDTSRAELSLWPDTVYNIQVTCKHKITGMMRRSKRLNVDTRQLVGTTSTSTTEGNTPTTITASEERGQPKMYAHVHPTDRVYIISALPTTSQLSGVVYPAFGALAFFLSLLVMFLFLRPQRKRFLLDADATEADTATLIGGGHRSSSRNSLESSTLHV
ncbi:transmembrane protein fend [Drosophila guanche]|uniref:Blast:Transmembrane protein fend n=1 Tax=Drosophila guanche TaxID=7266 RepID=A0A3B0K2N3_DROGU|nr:transmembrane protein fend [Drosophila guanche]SPP88545.1 blast:Transmembrane protein fend [Drosophila guanche]